MITQQVAETVADGVAQTWCSLTRSQSVFTSLGTDEIRILADALRDLLLVILITTAVYLTLRRAMMPVYRRMGERAKGMAMVPTALLFSGSVALDALTAMAAWGIGYAILVLAVGEFGTIGIRQSLYLNAFLVVQMTKVVLRALLSPSTAGLRPVPLSDDGARDVYRSAALVVSVLGFGQLLVVPIVNANASYFAGRGVSALILLFVLVYLVVLVMRRRKTVSNWLISRLVAKSAAPESDIEPLDAEPEAEPRAPRALAAIAQNWHWFAFAYLAVMLFIVLTRPSSVVFAAVLASLKIVLALVVASLVSAVIARTIAQGIRLPEHVNSRLPLLERRVNQLVPFILIGIRFLIMAAVTVFALDMIGVIEIASWFQNPLALQVTGTSASLILILGLSFAIWLAVASWVEYRLNPDYGAVPTAREQTLLTLLRNAVAIALFIFSLMFCLSEIGINIGPLLASAGVLGLAIGFGAQKMVQDIITGVFIQFENAINVGDVVTAGGITGGVEKLTVRSVSLRDVNGVFHIVPFSSVDMVSNFTRDFAYFVADMGVAYREDTAEAKQAMIDAFDELRASDEHGPSIIGDYEWFGLNSFGASEIILRGRIKTLPGKQWGIGRAYNEIVKRVFDERGIEIPFPHQTIYFGERKDGTTQTIHVATDGLSEGIQSETEPKRLTKEDRNPPHRRRAH
ncbi:mechanosensitive ion channel domain-containing protein [Ovoidimarina sediminis]|uniref:mechanosensitive ion channel domain-containing protein n=1 Tax=Ovoidimarina sediminis TaxID=3079856 RepID=UPI00290F4012|nr:mechanosensitive ion channel domain-containing protein [Rhodophyticola sp. MJ-SS7]MDU8944302.1 mechanosensitive ion channel [Rhodophyticola sp. MJ-SS7]